MSFVNIPAVLSVRLPSPARDRLKAAAAARGETVQGLVGALVDSFLAENGRRAPELAQVLGALRQAGPRLRERWDVAGLWVFGSVARGEAKPGSDVDLLCEFAPDARVSLVGLASLATELSNVLGAPADLAERASLRPGPARTNAERDAMRVL